MSVYSSHFRTENVDIDQYDAYAIPSETMPYWIYPQSLENQNEIPVDLLC